MTEMLDSRCLATHVLCVCRGGVTPQVRNLRSHGSRHEQIVPMLLSRAPEDASRLDTSTMDAANRTALVPGSLPQRNWDMFDLLLNP